MQKVFALLFLLTVFSASISPVFAQTATCQYTSTQARVHKDFSDPWKESMSLQLGESFEAAGFHNNTGELGNDVVIQVSGPNVVQFVTNGQKFTPSQVGKYTVFVNTRDRFGRGCSDKATVNVTAQTTCQYGSTQARVQKDFSDPWKEVITIRRGETFNVGSFHDTTGQFASDTTLKVTNPQQNVRTYRNGSVVRALQVGLYTLNVKTKNRTGGACEASAQVWVY